MASTEIIKTKERNRVPRSLNTIEATVESKVNNGDNNREVIELVHENDTHIRIPKAVHKKFIKTGHYSESAGDILDSLIDFYIENKDKPGVRDRKVKGE